MPWFARDRAIEMDDDLRRRVVEDPSRALAMPLEDVARVESAAAEREGKLSLSNGECAHAAAFYGLALRALALDRGRAPMDAGARRRKRIELRLRLGDALAGANEPGRACGAYAAALRQLGLIARRAKARENEENDVEDAPGRERRDGEDVEETYDDGGGRGDVCEGQAARRGGVFAQGERELEQGVDQGIGGWRGDVSHRSRVSNGGEV